jgi:hypothetical protein
VGEGGKEQEREREVIRLAEGEMEEIRIKRRGREK